MFVVKNYKVWFIPVFHGRDPSRLVCLRLVALILKNEAFLTLVVWGYMFLIGLAIMSEAVKVSFCLVVFAISL